jgi:GTP-binding protein
MDDLSFEALAATAPMEIRPSYCFADALDTPSPREQPTVAIVGRPNVGKSTLFNRVLGGRRAIVSERPGTTRDRHFGDAEWNGRRFWVVDTGGLIPHSSDSMDVAIRHQVQAAVQAADLVVLVVDGAGVNPVDQEIASRLRSSRRPVLVVVNKMDDLPASTGHLQFYELGLGDPSQSRLR